MDALALLSDDDLSDDEGREEDVEPAAKRLRSHVDFDALQRAGYAAGVVETSAEESLQNSFDALQSKANKLVPQSKPEAPLGCESAPDELEIYNGSNVALPRPWSTIEDIQQHIRRDFSSLELQEPTPLQAQVWPILAEGLDLLAVAKNGSGKTLGFLLPFVCACREQARASQGLFASGTYSPQVLILTTTREAASHIEAEAKRLSAGTGPCTLALHGGSGQRSHQLGQLRERPECLVSTLGRLHDFLQTERHWFSLQAVRALVIDSAEGLRKEVSVAPDAEIEIESQMRQGMSFCISQIRKTVMEIESAKRQTAIFASAMIEDVGALAQWTLRRPVEVCLGPKDPLRVGNHVEQRIIYADTDKESHLARILKQHCGHANLERKALVLAREFLTCQRIQQRASATVANCEIYVISEAQVSSCSNEALDAANVIITTHGILRSLKVECVACVVNYDPPSDAHQYVEELQIMNPFGPNGLAISLLKQGLEDRALGFIANVMKRSRQPVPKDLLDAYKQRCGRDLPPIDRRSLRYLDCRDERPAGE